jgi:hypothetical protein
LVLVHWADRLDAVVCATRSDVLAALDVMLGDRAGSVNVEIQEPAHLEHAQAVRSANGAELSELWADLRIVSRRRGPYCLEDLSFVLSGPAEGAPKSALRPWRFSLGETSVPDPAMLVRRVLNGEDPEREPALPRTRLRRRPLCLVAH